MILVSAQDSNLRRLAGMSEAGASCRNPEAEGPQILVSAAGFELEALSWRERSGNQLPKS